VTFSQVGRVDRATAAQHCIRACCRLVRAAAGGVRKAAAAGDQHAGTVPNLLTLAQSCPVACLDSPPPPSHTHMRAQASLIAEQVLAERADAVRVLFNKFQSAISFKPTLATVLSADVSVWICVRCELWLSGCKEEVDAPRCLLSKRRSRPPTTPSKSATLHTHCTHRRAGHGPAAGHGAGQQAGRV
jgi:hypothetical protein